MKLGIRLRTRTCTDPKSLMQKHLLALAVILTVATGCDNVAWGGIDVDLLPPPESTGPATGEVEVTEDGGVVNLAAPVLLAGVRNGVRADFVVVGEVHPGAVHPFPDPTFPEDVDRLSALTEVGSEWILFSDGVRVGRMVVDEAGTADGFCAGRSRVSGTVELVPTAAGAERLLALPGSDASDLPYLEYRALGDVYDQRVATLAIAGDAIPAYGARWPTVGGVSALLAARADIRAFQLQNTPGQTIAATFMYQDELSVASPRQGAYALFVMGQEVEGAYQESYTWYRAVETEGKGAPRYFDHLDWDGDGTDDVLLDVFGADRRWFAVLSQRDGSWVRTFQDTCGAGPLSGD